MDNIKYYAGIVEEYYNATRPNYIRNGYEKNVLIAKDTVKCIFVHSNVLPHDNSMLFMCKTVDGQTFCTLKTFKQKRVRETAVVNTHTTY